MAISKSDAAEGHKLLKLQLLLVGVALAVSGMFWLPQGNTNPTSHVLFTFIIGNCNWLAVLLAAPVIRQKSPPGLDRLSGRSSPYRRASELDRVGGKLDGRGPARAPIQSWIGSILVMACFSR